MYKLIKTVFNCKPEAANTNKYIEMLKFSLGSKAQIVNENW